ncbi:hypothetical protein JW926_19160 [Candidatus Sumerlaeota bacterium]|nr:hypothetical protein [Candidatus Sumerlaeota bacterium]
MIDKTTLLGSGFMMCLMFGGFANGAPKDAENIPLPEPKIYFKIQVVDEETGRGIPLVKLTTQDGVIYYTDSAGNVAFFEPALMNREVYIIFESHGYEMEKDGFMKQPAKIVKVVPGGSAQFKMKRNNLAQRLYRITGSGIYHDSALLGEKVPIEHPLMNAGVLGQDTTQVTIYKDKIFWIWGDTGHTRHPLSMNAHSTGATSELPSKGGLDPEIGVNLHYFPEGDFVKKMVDQPVGGGNLYWIGCLIAVKDGKGDERLVAHCSRIQAPMERVGRFTVAFNDAREVFEKVRDYPKDEITDPHGHPFPVKDKDGEYLYFFGGGSHRVKPSFESVIDHSRYDAFTCFKEGSGFDETKDQLDRAADGSLRFAWRKNTSIIDPKTMDKLIQKGFMKPEEKWFGHVDMETGKDIGYHGGTIYWNEYRKRWVMIFNEIFGTSTLGEIWYAEGDTPLGPWYYAKKIVTHDKYSFYNVIQHPHFAKEDGRIIFFEGTYTTFVSGTEIKTPRYDYNQIMYKLDLGDERCAVPVPVYRVKGEAFEYLTAEKISERGTGEEIVFWCSDRPGKNLIPIYEYKNAGDGFTILTSEKPEHSKKDVYITGFYALAPEFEQMKETTIPLWEWIHPETKKRVYKVEGEMPENGYVKNEKPLCRVWKYPRKFNPWKYYGYRRGR